VSLFQGVSLNRPTPLQLVFVLAAIIPVMPLTFQVFVGDGQFWLGVRSLFWAIEFDREDTAYVFVQEVQYSVLPPLVFNILFIVLVGVGIQNAVQRGYAKRSTMIIVAILVVSLFFDPVRFILLAFVRSASGESFGMGIDGPFQTIFVLGFLLLFSMRERPLVSPWD
jgi:hypothetical protein